MLSVLILDDDRGFTRAAGHIAEAEGFVVHQAHTVEHARTLLGQRRFDLLLLDLLLPDGSGMDLLEDIDLAEHGLVALVTGNPSIESAAQAVSAPVVGYLIKPLQPLQLTTLLQRARRLQHVPGQPADTAIAGLVGDSVPMRRVVDTVLRIGPSDASVLLAGESGTGKEVVARALHDVSGRRGGFVAINCGAVPSELLASELFGHERGSFTGAHARHAGVFEQAAHGTLLLDEITEMPLALQVYLLRILETGAVTRVGGSEQIATPVRIVAATNRDPLAAVAAGNLREDLYYRLADIPVTMPPLRDRGNDVVLLANLFIDRLNTRYGLRKRLATGAETLLLRHRWPGNVRELRSAVQRAYLMQPDDALFVRPLATRVPVWQEDDTSILFSVGTTLEDMERRALLKTLAYFDNDKTATARALGVSVRTIHNHLARLAGEGGSADPVAA
ncbi:MAG TPA: sigma-54 dependent transcriptional regulator [Luteimonas sp.]|nr:sigma-54 dependent transcriptional regulator [Luteimonas sp.]